MRNGGQLKVTNQAVASGSVIEKECGEQQEVCSGVSQEPEFGNLSMCAWNFL